MRALRIVPPGPAVLPALRAALDGGDAILVRRPSAGGRPADLPSVVPERVALVVETSGSTGRPKRVALSAAALRANTTASQDALGRGEWVLALPTHYIAGINVLARSLAAGTEPVAVEGEHFTARGFVDAAARLAGQARFVSLVPAQLSTLLDDADATAALRGFRALVGGQALPASLRERAAAAGVAVTRSYGSSESGGGCVYDGVPIGETRVRVVDGEVQLGGPVLAEGYLGDDALTADRFVEDDGMRWFRTADAGTWDGTRLTISGRRDDVVISGGVKVSLGAVERLLHEHGFPEAVVVRGRDDRWGEVPVAVIPGDADPAAAVSAIEAALGPAARPRVRRVSVIPLLPTGKPDRRALTGLA